MANSTTDAQTSFTTVQLLHVAKSFPSSGVEPASVSVYTTMIMRIAGSSGSGGGYFRVAVPAPPSSHRAPLREMRRPEFQWQRRHVDYMLNNSQEKGLHVRACLLCHDQSALDGEPFPTVSNGNTDESTKWKRDKTT